MKIGFWTEFDDLYTVQDQIELAALLKTSPDKLSYDAKHKILYAVILVDSVLEQKKGELTQKQVRARDALKIVTRQTNALLRALSDLDPDTRDLLLRRAILKFGFDDHHYHVLRQASDMPESILEPSSRWKEKFYSMWLMHLSEIETTVSTILEDLARSGPPVNEDRLIAIRDLIDVWKAHTKAEPTLSYNNRTRQTTGSVLVFCEIVLRPVFKANKTSINLERAVRDELYGRDRSRKRRQ